jgi:predicted esterase
VEPKGRIEHFRSAVDGELRPCAVCATDTSAEPKALILEVSPGGDHLPGGIRLVEEIAGVAARHGRACIALRPTGRGMGSVYQNYGEVDALEAIEHACRCYAVDRDRICVTGASMGGAATWYLTSHYPDLFAAGAPFCGYCDHRLWEKPGGLTFRMHEWEEPSWRSRSAAFLVENLDHTPLWIVHGEWDRSVGGGVPVEHSRQMDRLLEEAGCDHRYSEVPRTGHNCRLPDLFEEVLLWMLDQRKQRQPARVRLLTYGLRHNHSYWVTVEQLVRYGGRGVVDADLAAEGHLCMRTEGVRALSLGPMAPGGTLELELDGQAMGALDASIQSRLRRGADGAWARDGCDLSGEKRHASSGPIGDLFFEGTVLVPGTAGTEEETFQNALLARGAARYFRTRNGGVHRGGIMGENSVELPVVTDADLSDELRSSHNLILYGTPASNVILGRFRDQLPITFDGNTIGLRDRSFTTDRAAALAVFPHPEDLKRYLAVHGGVTPDAACWGSRTCNCCPTTSSIRPVRC